MPREMREQDEFEQPRIAGEQLPHVFEHGGAGVGRVHGPREENLLGDLGAVEAVLEKTGVTKPKKPGKTLDKLIQRGIVPDSDEWRELTGTEISADKVRKAKLGLLGEIEEYSGKIDLVGREKDTGWSDLRDRAEKEGLDADAFAKAYDERRKAAANIASATPPPPEPTAALKDLEKEKDDYYRNQLLKDLGIAADKTAPTDERSQVRARLTRNRILFDRRIQLDDIRDIEAIISDPDARAALGTQLSERLKNLSRLTGLDQSRLMRVHSSEIVDDGDTITSPFDVELEKIIAAATVGDKVVPSLAKSDLREFRRRYADVPEAHQSWQRAGEILVALNLQERGGTSAYGLTPEEMRQQYGIETGSKTNDDPIILEIRRPVTGCEIPFEMMGNYSPFGAEKRRAVNPQEAFLYDRVSELLAETYAAYLESYNGEVTNKSDMDPQLLGRIEAELKRKHDALKVQYESAMRGEDGLHFLSLIPFPDKGGVGDDPLGLAAIREKILSTGFKSLTPAELHMIPEIRTFEDLKALLSWHDAQSELIRTLQTIRSYATAKEIETMAGLGKSPDRLVMKTSSITKMWMLETLDRRKIEDGGSMADNTDKAMRIYGLIAQVAIEPMDIGVGSPRETVMRKLIREFLTGTTLITGGAKPKDSWYVLNRFGMNLDPERLATVEAFVDYLAANNVLNELGSTTDITELTVRVRSGLRTAIDNALDDLNRNLSEMKVRTTQEKERRLAIDNAVALIHVTGLADKWSGYLEWEPKKVDDYNFLPTYNDGLRSWVGKTMVGIYPACTAGAQVANYRNYSLAQLLEGKLVASQVLIDELLSGAMPKSLAHSFFSSTGITENTVKRNLWDMWWIDGLSLKEVAARMGRQVPENAIQFYFNSISAANSLAEILRGTDTTIFKEIDENRKAQAKINLALTFGLGMPYGLEKDQAASRLRAIAYAGPLVYGLGLSGQLTNEEVVTSLEDAGRGVAADKKIQKYLERILQDYLSLRTSQKVVGAMDADTMRIFVPMVERYYVKSRRHSITKPTISSPAVLNNIIFAQRQEMNVPYASVWNFFLGRK